MPEQEIKPRIYAHRGMLRQYPENTELAFDAARRSVNATGFECDIQSTKEGIAVVVHEKLERTTDAQDVFPQLYEQNGTIVPQDLTLDEIRQLDAGEKQRVLTVFELAKYFPTTSKHPLHIAYEIKADDVTNQVLETADARGPLEHSIFIGFTTEHLDAIKRREPQAHTFALFRDGDTITPLATRSRGHGIGVRIDACPDDILKKATRYNVPVLAYSPMIEGADFAEHARRLYHHPQIHGLVLNNPDRMLPQIQQ